MSDSRNVRFGVWYDFRNPRRWRRAYEDLYADYIEQIVWAEEIGFDSVWLTEHHFCDDGYTPSPLVILAAVAARTRRIRLGTNLLVPALHHPVRLAEDAATLAVLSNGRFDLGVAAGYRELEFEAFGRRLAERPSLLEEAIEICRRAWTGEPVAFAGKRFTVPALAVQPAPATPPRILVGGHVDAALDRAARLGEGFLAPYRTDFDRCLAAMKRVGKDPADARITICDFTLVAEDPEQMWATAGAHAVYQINEYIRWEAGDDASALVEKPQDLLDTGTYRLLDGDAAIEDLTAMLERWPQIEDVSFWAQLPGEPLQSGSARMQLIAHKVLPEVRRRLGIAAPASP